MLRSIGMESVRKKKGRLRLEAFAEKESFEHLLQVYEKFAILDK